MLLDGYTCNEYKDIDRNLTNENNAKCIGVRVNRRIPDWRREVRDRVYRVSRGKYCVSVYAILPSDFIPYLLDDLGKGKSYKCTNGLRISLPLKSQVQ